MSDFALVVEDDIDLSELFAQAMRAAGFQTEAVYDGRIAQQRLSALTPQVVVLDMHLPNVSGETLFQQIRADERLKDTRVIVATSDALIGDEMRSVADYVLIKPTSFVQLRDLAKRLISK